MINLIKEIKSELKIEYLFKLKIKKYHFNQSLYLSLTLFDIIIIKKNKKLMRIQLINTNILNFVYLKNVQKLEKRSKKFFKIFSKEQIKIKKIV